MFTELLMFCPSSHKHIDKHTSVVIYVQQYWNYDVVCICVCVGGEGTWLYLFSYQDSAAILPFFFKAVLCL